jgi:S1-C subfamily serine protease
MAEDRVFARRLAMVAVAAVLVGIAWALLPALRDALLPRPPAEPRLVAPRGDLAGDEQATIALFEAAQPSVVFITTAAQRVDPFTRNIFAVPRGTGSGFLWDARGHVVTNAHVLEGASAALVRLADGSSWPAELVGTDPRNDLAVLRIAPDADMPPALAVGTSDDLQVGQKVFAIGNPFGFDFTLTTGIVSALGRELPAERGFAIRGLIQTDAAINPGNSGGPLLDSAGRLIGVNTAIYSPTGGSAGIGFAVPVDTVNRVVPQLIETGRYAPPSLGIEVDPQINEMAARQGVEGVLVLGIFPGSPADAAGLEPARFLPDGRIVPGDIIVRIDDVAVPSVADLLAELERREIGDRVSVTVLRNGRQARVEVTLEAAAG